MSHRPSATPSHRLIGVVAIAAALALPSCAGSVERPAVIPILEALQRPFDLQGVTVVGIPAELPAHFLLAALLAAVLTWLWRPVGACASIAALIVVKEVLDLAIITLYEPLTWTYLSDSALDVVVSLGGVGIGVLGVTRARRRRGAGSGRS